MKNSASLRNLQRATIPGCKLIYEVMRPLKRERCFLGLKVDQTKIPKIIDGIDLLSTDLGLSHTPRTFQEQHGIFADLGP